ncbi:MAG TPA: hypothetical protein PLT66_01125 [Bacillota bacterium]|nr:hypothetical protein [Bacillota bacterium]
MKKTFRIMICLLLSCLMAAGCTGNDLHTESGAVSANTSADTSADVSSDTSVDRSSAKELVSYGCSYTVTGSPHGTYADDGTTLTDGVTRRQSSDLRRP